MTRQWKAVASVAGTAGLVTASGFAAWHALRSDTSL